MTALRLFNLFGYQRPRDDLTIEISYLQTKDWATQVGIDRLNKFVHSLWNPRNPPIHIIVIHFKSWQLSRLNAEPNSQIDYKHKHRQNWIV